MGGVVTLRLITESRERAEAAARAAFDRFAQIEQVASDYRPSSEIRTLSRERWTPISPDLETLLATAVRVSLASHGAYDPTCSPLVELWRVARTTGRAAAERDIEAVRDRVGFQRIKLRPGEAWIPVDTALDFGGIAKGYACDQALAVIGAHGIRYAAVQAGGDTALGDSPPDQEGWAVDILGSGVRFISNCAVATSGPSEQPIPTESAIYSHILDPRTGNALENSSTITVIAERALFADPVATAISVAGRHAKLEREFNVRAVFLSGGPDNPT